MSHYAAAKVKTHTLAVARAGTRVALSVDAASEVTGVLPAANGGTGTAAANSATAAYIKTTDGVQTLLAAAAFARRVLIHVLVTEVFADGTGSQPTFKIGETDADDKFAATTELTDAAAAAVKTYAGTLASGKALLVTAVDATGNGTGAITVTALALA